MSEDAVQRVQHFVDGWPMMRGNHPNIIYTIWCGDDEAGRELRRSDLLALLSMVEASA